MTKNIGKTIGQATFQEAVRSDDVDSDADNIPLYTDRIQTCQDPECKQQAPHVHAMQGCSNHNFCSVLDFEGVPDAEDQTTLPFPMKYELGKTSQQVKQYERTLNQKRVAVQLKDMGLKCVVSDYALASWYAQSFKLDMHNLPMNAPAELNKTALSSLDGRQTTSFTQITQFLRRINDRDIPEKDLVEHIKKTRQKGIVSKGGEIKEMLPPMEDERDKKDPIELMRKLKPLVYPITKDVKKFQEFGIAKSEKAGKYQKERETSLRERIRADESLSQSSIEGPNADTVKAARHSMANQNSTTKARAILVQNEGGFAAIAEENKVSNADLADLEHDGKDGEEQSQASKNRLIVRQIQKMRKTQSHAEKKRRWVYNPYVSEPIKHMNDLSRGDIAKLMTKIKKDQELKRESDIRDQFQQKSAGKVISSIDAKDEAARGRSLTAATANNVQSRAKPIDFSSQLTANRTLTDISMRARREQQFRDRMQAEFSVGGRKKGILISKVFTRKTNGPSNDVQTTCFQYIDQFQDVTTSGRPSVKERTQSESASKLLSPQRITKVPVTANLVDKLRAKRGLSTGQQHQRRIANTLSGIQEDSTFNSTINAKNRIRVASTSQDRNLSSIINRKHRNETSVTQPHAGQKSPDDLQAKLFQSTKKSRQDEKPFHSHARRHIQEMLSNKHQYLDRDLRRAKNPSEMSMTYNPYNPQAFYSTEQHREITITPSLMQDITILTNEQHRGVVQSIQTHLSEDYESRPVFDDSTGLKGKKVNQVSFRQASGQIASDDQFDRVSKGAMMASQEYGLHVRDMMKPEEQLSVPSTTHKQRQGSFRISHKTGEDALTADDNKSSQQDGTTSNTSRPAGSERKGGYFVTPEDYNFEVSEPHQYFQKELFVKLPLSQPKPSKANHELDIFKSAEFWLSKGYGIQSRAHQGGNRKKQDEADNVALDYYLSGVKIDPQHFGCIYNAGCCHFFTGKFKNARKWFNLTTLVDPLCPDGYYGKALSCLKLGLYEEALDAILQIDQKDDSKPAFVETKSNRTSQLSVQPLQMKPSKRFTVDQITFLHAVCCKILNRQDQAQALYQKLEDVIYKTQCKKMITRTFAVVLVTLQKERNVTEDNVSQFQKLMNMYDPTHLFDKSTETNLLRLAQPQPDIADATRLKFLSKFLTMFPFFQRVSFKQISSIIDKIQIITKQKDELVIIPPNNQVMIILNGQIVNRQHELENPGDFNIMGIGKSGHILFAPELDQGNSNQPLVWPVIYSQTAQLALIDRATFEEIWKYSRNREVEVTLSQLNLHIFFKSLSKQTFHRIITEKSFLFSFKPGQLVMPIHPRSPWNNHYFKRYAQKQLSALEQLEAKQIEETEQEQQAEKARLKEEFLRFNQHKNVPQSKAGSKTNTLMEGMKLGMMNHLISNIEDQSKSNRTDKANLTKAGQQMSTFSAETSMASDIGSTSSPARRRNVKQGPSDYEKLVNALRDQPKHETIPEFKLVLEKQRLRAQKRLIMIQNGQDVGDMSEFSDSDYEYEKAAQQQNQNIVYPEKSFKRPVMLMFNGTARCINRHFPNMSFVAKRLATGSILGESDALEAIGIDFFGDIYAEKHGLQCLVIQKPDLVLDVFEKKILNAALGMQHHDLQNMLETRFKELKEAQLKKF